MSSKRKKVIIIIGGVLVLLPVAGGGAFAYLHFRNQPAATDQTIKQELLVNTQTSSWDRTSKADKYLIAKQPQQAINLYRQFIASTNDVALQSQMYLEIANLLDIRRPFIGSGFNQQILDFALKAEELKPTAVTANAVAQYAKLNGDSQMASKYEKLVDERLSDATPPDPRM